MTRSDQREPALARLRRFDEPAIHHSDRVIQARTTMQDDLGTDQQAALRANAGHRVSGAFEW